MVVTFLPPMVDTCVWQDLTALPSIWTVQAPHRPEPHPYFVPVSFRCSRTTQSSAVSGSASTLTALPLIVNATAVMGFLPGNVSPIHPVIFRLNRRMVIVFRIARKSGFDWLLDGSGRSLASIVATDLETALIFCRFCERHGSAAASDARTSC